MKFHNPFRLPSAREIAARQLAESERELLRAELGLEQWQAQRDMLISRCARLRATLQNFQSE